MDKYFIFFFIAPLFIKFSVNPVNTFFSSPFRVCLSLWQTLIFFVFFPVNLEIKMSFFV